MDFDFTFGRRDSGNPGELPRRARPPRVDDEPMRILLLGDFGGNAERQPLANRPTLRVDVDNVTDVIRRIRPSLNMPAGRIGFATIDDFHPDSLHTRVDRFTSLREARVASVPGDEDVARLLGKPAQSRPTSPPPSTGLDALIRDIVKPHIVKDNTAERAPYRAAVDAATAESMRQLLHAPEFQALEASWRGVQWLISNLELDERLQLHLLDLTRGELLAEAAAAQGDLTRMGLHNVMVDRTRNVPGGQPWSVTVTLFDFGPGDDDIRLLYALGALAAQAGGVVLAGANAALVNGDSPGLAGWQALRRSDVAPSIGLTAPRVLLRLPYGKNSDPIESFSFEELPGEPAHDGFLWGAASLATALVVGRAFSAHGWDMDPDDGREIGDLPAYTVVRDGERELQACAERFMSERETDRLLAAGIMPIASRRDRNAVVAIRFQSIADPPAPLAW